VVAGEATRELNVPTITLVTVFGPFSSVSKPVTSVVSSLPAGQLQPNRELLLLDHAGDRARGAGERKTLLLGSNN